MRFLPAILARIYRPVPFMDTHSEARQADAITRDLNAAVSEHERVAKAERADYAACVQETIDDLLKRMGKQE